MVTSSVKPLAAVIGASGFLGSHLVDALLAEGYTVRALSRSFPGLISTEAVCNPRLAFFRIDLANRAELEHALTGVEVCFHLVSTTLPSSSNLDPAFDVASNLLGSINLMEVARIVKVRRIVFASSGGTVYGKPCHVPISENHRTDPTCSYGITKLAIEKFFSLYRELHGIDTIVLRIANPFGERQRHVAAQGAIAVFLSRAIKGELINVWGNGNIIRDYIYVGDVVGAMLAAAECQGKKYLFNIGSGHGLSINQVIEAIACELNAPVKINYQEARGFDVPSNVLDIGLAKLELKWSPKVSFREGLSRMHKSLPYS